MLWKVWRVKQLTRHTFFMDWQGFRNWVLSRTQKWVGTCQAPVPKHQSPPCRKFYIVWLLGYPPHLLGLFLYA